MDGKEKIVRSVDKLVKEHLPEFTGKTQIIISRNRAHLEANIMVFQAFAYLAATKLKYSTLKVLMLFFSYSAYENVISMDIKTIAEDLEMPERTVIRALQELQTHNIIIKAKHVSDRRRNEYFINPLAAWKGNSNARKTIMGKLRLTNPDQLLLFGQQSQLIQPNKGTIQARNDKK